MTPTDKIGSFFERDHRELDRLFATLRHELSRAATEGKGDVSSLLTKFTQFDQRLDRHIRWEEELLFPAVEEQRPELREGPGRVMRMEHEEIHRNKAAARALLSQASPSPENFAKAYECLKQVLSTLEQHNVKEEQIYYPMSEHVIPHAKKEALLKRLEAEAASR